MSLSFLQDENCRSSTISKWDSSDIARLSAHSGKRCRASAARDHLRTQTNASAIGLTPRLRAYGAAWSASVRVRLGLDLFTGSRERRRLDSAASAGMIGMTDI